VRVMLGRSARETTIRMRGYFSRRVLASVLVAVVTVPADAKPGSLGENLSVRLRIRVAECADGGDGARVAARPPGWVDDHVKAVQALLAPHGITVTAERETFAPGICEVLTRADRDALAEHVVAERGGGKDREGDRAVTVLVLPRVRDLDVLTYDLMGVHWRGGGRRWIFLTARAQPPVLAHELCHYFGLPHDPAGGNLMTPGPSSPLWKSAHPPRPFAPVLTPGQVERLRAGITARGR
jgi:hypothetical protein